MDLKALNFTIFCVGSVADYLKMNVREVYHRLNDSQMNRLSDCFMTLKHSNLSVKVLPTFIV